MNLKTRLKDMGASALIAFMLSFSLTCTLLRAVAEDCPYGMAALCCGAAALLCALVALNKITAVAGAALAAGAVIFAAAGGGAFIAARLNPLDALRQAVEAVGARMGGEAAGLRVEMTTPVIYLAALFGVVSFLMVRLTGGVYPAVLLFVFVLLGSWFLSQETPGLPLIPGLIALAVMYAQAFRENGAMLRALPAALIAAVLAVLLTPASPLTWGPLQDAADKVREMFNDYFRFNDPRIVYSVSADGYQPAVEALGGPATPRPDDVMRVRCDESLLLRGSVSRTYTGRVWTDEAVNSRYLYLDPTRQGRRSQAFDLDKTDRLNGLLHKVSAGVTFLDEGTSTLFVPHRLLSLSTRADMPAYYNETGEVFITRGVTEGDSYAFEAWIPDRDWAAVAEAVNAAAAVYDPDWEDMRQAYTTLPGTIEANLYWLLMDLTENAETPIEKALAIRDYLLSGELRYTVEGRYPESGRDFVSWFVLDEKQGYCTYFASAMAVMARLAGIPSRYAEGYRVIADQSGETVVTGKDAHAWSELYFNGVGWLTFDVTPGEDGRQNPGRPDNSGEDARNEPAPTPEPSPTPPPAPESGDGQTDEPETSDEPSQTEQPDESGTATPEPEGEPSPEPDSQPTPEPDAPPEDPDNRGDAPKPPFPTGLLLALLILAALIWLLVRRMKRTAPKYMAAREKDARVKAMIWYRAVLKLLERSGLSPEGGETPQMFAARAVAAGGVPDELARFSQLVAQAQYAPKKPGAQAAALGEKVYNALLRGMTRRQRFDWTVNRMLHGIGDYTQIP